LYGIILLLLLLLLLLSTSGHMTYHRHHHPSLDLKAGVDLDITDGNGRTALHLASARGNEAICRLLLENNAKLGIADKDGKTAMRAAAEARHGVSACSSPSQCFSSLPMFPFCAWLPDTTGRDT
jgi:ankyrin repeat protein